MVFALAVAQADKDGVTPKEHVVKRTAGKLIHDAKIQAKKDINFILFEMIYHYVYKLVAPAMNAVLDPLAAMIPSPLEPLLDVKDMAREVCAAPMCLGVFSQCALRAGGRGLRWVVMCNGVVLWIGVPGAGASCSLGHRRGHGARLWQRAEQA